MVNKSLTILFLLCLFYSPAYGSELLSEEASNYYYGAVKAQGKGDFYNAEVNYQKCILLDTGYKKFAFNNYGVMYANKGDMSKAEFAFKEALRIDPGYKAPAFNLSLLYLKMSISCKSSTKMFDYIKKAYRYYPEKSFIIERAGGY